MEYLQHGFQLLIVILAFSFIIFFHELGHLLAAMWRGLHIERFSVGFGAPLWKRTFKGVEYCIGWIPLGGYVALPQLDAADTPETFDRKPLPTVGPIDRIIVAFAGPLFNIFLGFVLSILVWQFGVPNLPHESRLEVGDVESIMVYDGVPRWTPEWEAGLRAGDVITAVNGEGFKRGWEEVNEAIIFGRTKHVVLTIERDGEEKTIEYDMLGSSRAEGLWLPNFVPGYDVVVAGISEDTKFPAHGKLKLDDTILAVSGVPVRSAGAAVALIRERGQEPVTLTVLPAATKENPNPQQVDITLTPALETFKIKPKKYMAGFGWSTNWPMPTVTAVPDGTQAADAGLQVGDVVLEVDGQPVLTVADMGTHAAKAAAEGRALPIKLMRDGEVIVVPVMTGSTPGTENIFTNLTGAELEVAGITVNQVFPNSASEAAGLQVGDQVLELADQPITTLAAFTEQLQARRNAKTPLKIRRDGEEMTLQLEAKYVAETTSEKYLLGIEPAWRKVLVHPTPLDQFGRTARQIQTMLRRIVSRDNPIKVKHMSTFPGIAMIMKQSVSSGVMTFINILVFINFMLAIVNLFPLPILDGGHIVFGLAELIARRRLPTKPVRILQTACFFLLVSFILYVLWYDVARVGKITGDWFDRPQQIESADPPPDDDAAPAPVPQPEETPEAPQADTTPPANT